MENFIIIDFTYVSVSKNKEQVPNAKDRNISLILFQLWGPIGCLVDSLAGNNQTHSCAVSTIQPSHSNQKSWRKLLKTYFSG